ncbi:MAG: hypothetical protein IK032_05060 [Bacteroidales bacterium]|nr:hypothetical protein [Bacteroidales bacterium]
MNILKIYMIGFLVCFLVSLLIEHLYYGDGRAETVSFKSLKENFFYSFLSWAGVVGEILFLALEWYTGFSEKGYGAFLHDLEGFLKNNHRQKENEKH